MLAVRPPRRLLHVLTGALLLRAVALGAHALWLDEGATWSWATKPTWAETLFAEANHPPAWWLITRAWIGVFGDSESALRMPAALLGVVTVWIGWCVALRLLHPTLLPRRGGFVATTDERGAKGVALWFAGFLAVSAFLTEYAQEARMYSLLITEALGLSWLYLRWLDDAKRRWLVSYAVLGALALYTHYFGLWVLLSHGLHALWVARRARATDTPFALGPFVVAGLAAGLLFAPWAFHLVSNYERIATGDPYNPFARLGYVFWRMGVGGGLVVVDRARQQQGIAATIGDEVPWIVGTCVLWFVPVIAGFAMLRKRGGTASFVLCNALGPALWCLLVFPFFPLIHERYLVFMAPWVIFLATVGAREVAPRWRPILTGALCVLFGVGALAYHGASVALIPQGARAGAIGAEEIRERHAIDPNDALTWMHNGHAYGKEPWRDARAFVHARSTPQDVVLVHPWYLRLVWDYYDRGRLRRIELPRHLLSVEEVDTQHGEVLGKATRVFLVLAHEETEDPDAYVDVVRQALAARWLRDGLVRFQHTRPIWFDRSWGVRVAVFNRRPN